MNFVEANLNPIAWTLFLGEAARGNPQAQQTLREYVCKLDSVVELARQGSERLPHNHASQEFFHTLAAIRPSFIASLHPQADPYGLPMASQFIGQHEQVLQRLATFHNRAAGQKKNTAPGFFNALVRVFESAAEQSVPAMDPSAPETQDLLPDLMTAIRSLLDAAAGLSWNLGN